MVPKLENCVEYLSIWVTNINNCSIYQNSDPSASCVSTRKSLRNSLWQQSCANLLMLEKCKDNSDQSKAGSPLCLTPAAEGLGHRNLISKSTHSFLFTANKAKARCYPPPQHSATPRSNPALRVTPRLLAQPTKSGLLHDKVQSGIIKLEKDRETERNWHRHQTQRKGLVRGRTQQSGSGANFWIGALKRKKW